MPRAERRAQLLRTAHDIIQNEGIGALTMSALAEQSGASKPVVYEHFENSESVAIELLDEFYKNIIARSFERIVDPETVFDYFDMVVDVMFDFYFQERTFVRNITNGFSSSSEVNEFYLEQQEHSHAVYRELLLQQGISQRVAHVASYALMEMIGATVQEFPGIENPVERDTLKRLVRGLVGCLVKGRGTKPSLPTTLLHMISTAGEAHSRPARNIPAA